MKRGSILLNIAFLLLSLGFLWASVQLSTASAWIAQAVLAVTLFALILQLAVELPVLKWPTRPEDPASRTHAASRPGTNGTASMLPALAWVAALPLAIWLVGTAFGSGLFCVAWLRWHSGESWTFSVLFALTLGAGTQLLFGTLLGADLGAGVLPGLLSQAACLSSVPGPYAESGSATAGVHRW